MEASLHDTNPAEEIRCVFDDNSVMILLVSS